MTTGFPGGGDVAGVGACEVEPEGPGAAEELYGGGGGSSVGSALATASLRFSSAAEDSVDRGDSGGTAGVGGGD